MDKTSKHIWTFELLQMPQDGIMIKLCVKCRIIHSIESANGAKIPLDSKDIELSCEEIITRNVIER